MLFGELVRRQRIERGLTLTELAFKLSMDSANLCKIENGKRNLNKKRLTALSESLDMDLTLLKKEYVSDWIAKNVFDNKEYHHILELAESKVKYYRKLDAVRGEN